MPNRYRRREDGEDERSPIRKTLESPGADLLIRAVITVALGTGAGYVGTEQKSTEVTQIRAELVEAKLSLETFKKSYYENQRRTREQRDAEHLAARDRLTAIETELRLARERRR